MQDSAAEKRGVDLKAGEGPVAVERVTQGTVGAEDEVVGVHADVRGDKDRVAGEVDEGDEASGGGAGAGDDDGVLGGLTRWTYGIDGGNDRPIGVAASDERCQHAGCHCEPGCGPDGLKCPGT